MRASAFSCSPHAHCRLCCPPCLFFLYLHPLLVFLSHLVGAGSGNSQQQEPGSQHPRRTAPSAPPLASCLWLGPKTRCAPGGSSRPGVVPSRPFTSTAQIFHNTMRQDNELLPLKGHCQFSWPGNDGSPRIPISFHIRGASFPPPLETPRIHGCTVFLQDTAGRATASSAASFVPETQHATDPPALASLFHRHLFGGVAFTLLLKLKASPFIKSLQEMALLALLFMLQQLQKH